MSTIDLTEATEAAARETFAAAFPDEADAWEGLPADLRHRFREHVLPALTAAAPVLEAAVRTQVAAELHEGGHHHAAHATRRASFWEGRR